MRLTRNAFKLFTQTQVRMLDERISIAPMMEMTDCHWRMMLRGITKKTVLYTEMVVDDTVNHTDNRMLDFFIGKNIEESPSVIQLGGYNPETLAQAAETCEQYGGGYSEINLNCGCPSQRVAKRCFGAKLMLEPDLVREIVHSMQRRVSIPITVKCRIGADDQDSYAELLEFIRSASAGGAKKFIVHSRKCFLNGLSTKQNRDVPPLKYEVVHSLVKEFPELTFVLNGGIQTFSAAKAHLTSFDYSYSDLPVNAKSGCIDLPNRIWEGTPSLTAELPPVHGVMIGRAAFSNPLLFATADSTFYGIPDPCLSRREVVARYIDYCEWAQSELGPHRPSGHGPGRQSVSTSGRYNLRNIVYSHLFINVNLNRYLLIESFIQCNTTIILCHSSHDRLTALMRPMHNLMVGLQHCGKYKMALNDLYVARVQGVNGVQNPNPREIVRTCLCVI